MGRGGCAVDRRAAGLPSKALGLSGGSAWDQAADQGWGREGRPQTAAASEELRKQAEEMGAGGRGAGGQGQRVSKAALLDGRSWTVKQDEWPQTSEQQKIPKVVSLLGGEVLT